ncbi:cytochrome P450 CYP82D47-like protein [Tanacetum coccineum]
MPPISSFPPFMVGGVGGRLVMLVSYGGHTTIKSTSMISIASSADTTTVMLTWTICLLLNNPRALMNAQEEVDNIVGRVVALLLPMFDIVLVVELLMLLMTSVVICAIADDVTVNLHRTLAMRFESFHTVSTFNYQQKINLCKHKIEACKDEVASDVEINLL